MIKSEFKETREDIQEDDGEDGREMDDTMDGCNIFHINVKGLQFSKYLDCALVYVT
jgi:hypothetical protein